MDAIAAVVLAAGKGTRMKSDRAKVLHQACGRPLAYFPIRAAFALDCAPVVAVVGHQATVGRSGVRQRQPADAPVPTAHFGNPVCETHAMLASSHGAGAAAIR